MTVGVIDGRRRGVPWTGIGRYVSALHRGFGEGLADTAPAFISGMGFRVTVDGDPDRVEVLARWRKFVWEQVSLPAWLTRQRPAFIHLPWYEGPRDSSVPLVVTIHDLDTLIHPSRYSRKVRFYYNGLLLKYAEVAKSIIVCSETTRRDVDRHLRVGRKCTVVYQGIDSDFLKPDRLRGRDVLQNLDVPQGGPVIISGSGVGIRKNLGVVGTALKLLKLRGWDPVLIVTACTEVPAELLPAQSAGVAIIATGVLTSADLAALYSVADVSVSPSLYEGFGFSIVESMAAGCPVVASSAGSHPEVACGGALLFDPLSADELAFALSSVLTDAGLRDQLIRLGRARASAFSWNGTVRATADVYERL
jgi:glycosyltransferase involved in cell wall biosynthesis